MAWFLRINSIPGQKSELLLLAKSSIACKLALRVRGSYKNGIAAICCGGAVTVVGTEAV